MWIVDKIYIRSSSSKRRVAMSSALQHGDPDVAGLVSLYAKLGRMRLISSPSVLASVGEIERKIVDTYLAPDKSFLELREMIHSGSVDLLRDFSIACRAEFEFLHRR